MVANKPIFAQQSILRNYSLEQGLPQVSVLSMAQDEHANIWLGTQGGVSRFDGTNFQNFDTRHGLSGNHISCILADSKYRIWFGHRYNGVSYMEFDSIYSIGFTDKRVTSIKEDSFGNIWFSTFDKGIFILPNDKKPSIENFIHLTGKIELSDDIVLDMFIYGTRVWVATYSGLSLINFSPDLLSFEIANFSMDDSPMPLDHPFSFARGRGFDLWVMGYNGIIRMDVYDSLMNKEIRFYPFDAGIGINYLLNIIVDHEGTVWGTHEYGVYRIKEDKLDFSFSGYGLPRAETNRIMEDLEGNIWIGTAALGVFKFSGDKFQTYNVSSGLLNNVISSVIEDYKGNIWIASEAGINIYDGKKYSYLTTKNGLPDNSVDVLYEDSKGNIWIGYYSEGNLLRYNPSTGDWREFSKKEGMLTNSVLTITEDLQGRLWFATLGYGVSRYSYPTSGQDEKFETFSIEEGLCSNNIWKLYTDKAGDVWFGSNQAGLSKYDGSKFSSFNEKDGLTNLSPAALTSDSENNLWIASIGGGIFKYDGNKFTNYSIAAGLSSDSPFSIICDNDDHVWVGTNQGIDKFDPLTETFSHYGREEGFVGIENNQNAAFRSQDGILWFGTINGVIRFDPSKDKFNAIQPHTYIRNIQLYYKDFNYLDHADAVDPLSHLPLGLVLGYKENHLTFYTIGVCQTAPEKVRYQYLLENFDEEWNPITTSTEITYTNIPPGEYVFKARACNNDGVWNDHPVEVSFTILTPLWQKSWFKVLFVFSIVSIIYLIFWYRLRNIKLQKIKLESLVDEKTSALKFEINERIKAQQTAEAADKLKTAFLANMSHEIRTPVNAIVGFSDLLRDPKLKESDKEMFLNYIINGGRSLLNLINDIIDISKIEAGQIRVEKLSCDLYTMMNELHFMYTEQLRIKNKTSVVLQVSNYPEDVKLTILTDPFRLKQVFINLLSNAFKFTEKGSIEFGYKVVKNNELLFYVKDSGIGIPADKQEIIFHRFRQVEETYTRNYEGTGLGLAISKKLVELMGGNIWVESLADKGSTFYFTLPLEKSKAVDDLIKTTDFVLGKTSVEDKNVLVVEDEDSNYLLIESMLSGIGVNLHREVNGMSAVEYFESNMKNIDLILMDIKIPGMNGYDATKAIRKLSAKVPIIAQTAYAMAGEEERCMEVGCSDYISKPYNKNQLLKVIYRNL